MESTLRECNSPRKRNYGIDIILPDRYFHILLPIVTKHELGLPFPSRNLPIKFGTNPYTIFLVIVVTDRHTDKPTPVKHTPSLSRGKKHKFTRINYKTQHKHKLR